MQNEVKQVDLDSDPDDGLSITVNEDGSIVIDWDETDPRWAMLNGLTNADLERIIAEQLKQDPLL
tara:strand:+ start:3609 stop:3803 length:195 start_codon:yes stop_codon:yes gene_type:complete